MIDQKIIEGDFNSDFRKLFRIKGFFFLPAKLFSVAVKKKKSLIFVTFVSDTCRVMQIKPHRSS